MSINSINSLYKSYSIDTNDNIGGKVMKNKSNNGKAKKVRTKGGILSRSIQTKILIPFLTLLILAVGAVAVVSYQSSADNTTDELTKNVESQMVGMNDTFEMFFSNISNTLDRFIANELIHEYQPETRQDLLQYFSETQSTDSSIANLYTAIAETGEVIIYPEADLGADFDPKERDWYQNALESDDSVWTEPYLDESSGELVVTVSKAYYDNSENLLGVMGADIMVGTLMDMMSSLTIGETGYGIVIDDSGKYVVHPEQDYIGEDQSEEAYYKEIINTGEQGMIEYQFDGKDNIMAFVKNPTTGWILGGTVNVQEFQDKAQVILIPISITLGIALILTIIVTYWVTNRITVRIKTVMDRMNQIANGELNNEPLETKFQDETGQLTVATNEMNENMRNLLTRIHEVSGTVTSQSEVLTQSSNEVVLGSEQVAATMQEIAAGSESQANNAGSLSSKMDLFTTIVQEANKNGELIQQSSNEVLLMTNEGAGLMNSSTEQMAVIDQIVHQAVGKVEGLDTHTQEISELVSVIQDISDQTNLLALNAAIEAARAGEYGKGFAVVADEVRKLAEQSSNSVTNITDIVNRIQSESSTVVTSLKEGYKDVSQGTEQIITTGKTFAKISTAVTDMGDKINQVAKNLSDIATNNQEMNTSIEEIAAVSEESAAGVEQASASTEQTSSAMEEVAATSDDLAKLAEELNRLVNQFKI